MDSHKIRLLRCYSKSTFKIEKGTKPKKSTGSGLEKLLPRSSSPVPDDHKYLDDNAVFDPYEIFRHAVESPMRRARVRGRQSVPYHFISGQLVQMDPNEKFDFTTISFNTTNEVKPIKKLSMKRRLASFTKTMKNFFKKYYRTLIRNKCDYSICPVTCECQRLKSFLNKTIVLDDVDVVEGL